MSRSITSKNTRRNKRTYLWQTCLIWGSMLFCMALSYLYWLLVKGHGYYEDFQGLFPVFLWCVLVVLNASLGIIAMILAWRTRPRWLYGPVYIYFIGSFFIHAWVFLDYINLDEKFYTYYQSFVHPDDIALHQELSREPLEYATISRLLKEGANADSRVTTWAIWKAYRQKDYPVMKLLLDNGAKPDQPSRYRGVTYRIDGPLNQLLLQRDSSTTLLCEIVDRREGGETEKSLKFIQHLLIAGADPKQTCLSHDDRPLSIQSLAAIRNDADVLQILNNFGASITLEQDRETAHQRLWDAAYQGNQPMFDALLKMLPPEDTMSVLSTALTKSILSGQSKMALNLLAAGAKPEQEDLIVLSIEKCDGNRDLVRALVAAGQDANVENSRDQTPLVLAFKRKDLPLLDTLIATGADVNRTKMRYGLLHHIFTLGPDLRKTYAKRLIAAGANLGRRDSDDYTFLMRAAYLKDIELVALALNNGADQNAVTSGLELTAEKLALKQNADDALITLLEMSERPSPSSNNLVIPAEKQPAKDTEALAKQEVDVQAINAENPSALETATRQNLKEVYLPLLNTGASPNLMIKDGSPLLEINRESISARVRRLRGLNQSDDLSIPIIASAALAGKIEVMSALLAAGADPDARSASGDTPLHLVAIAGMITGQHQAATTQLLVQSGANINAVNSSGYTPITLAARHRALAMIETLAGLNADLNAPDPQGRTVLGQTLRNGSIQEHIEGLLILGAQPRQEDLEYARSRISPKMVSILEVAVN